MISWHAEDLIYQDQIPPKSAWTHLIDSRYVVKRHPKSRVYEHDTRQDRSETRCPLELSVAIATLSPGWPPPLSAWDGWNPGKYWIINGYQSISMDINGLNRFCPSRTPWKLGVIRDLIGMLQATLELHHDLSKLWKLWKLSLQWLSCNPPKTCSYIAIKVSLEKTRPLGKFSTPSDLIIIILSSTPKLLSHNPSIFHTPR